jgi:hypothetical protein
MDVVLVKDVSGIMTACKKVHESEQLKVCGAASSAH